MLPLEVRHHRLEIGDERHVGARARARRRDRRSPRGSRLVPQRGARRATSPVGPATNDPPGKTLPPSLPTRLASETNTPCSSAMSRISRSQRLTLAGPGTSSRFGHGPRAGGAAQTKMICAPSSAAIVAVRLCHASSQTSIAARPHGVSNARTSRPRSTKRSSSNSPYVGRKTLRWTCADLRLARAECDVHRTVVQLVVPDFVEAERHVERPSAT